MPAWYIQRIRTWASLCRQRVASCLVQFLRSHWYRIIYGDQMTSFQIAAEFLTSLGPLRVLDIRQHKDKLNRPKRADMVFHKKYWSVVLLIPSPCTGETMDRTMTKPIPPDATFTISLLWCQCCCIIDVHRGGISQPPYIVPQQWQSKCIAFWCNFCEDTDACLDRRV